MDIRKAIAMIGHIREYIVENQDDHEYAEPIDMAIEALKKRIPVRPDRDRTDGTYLCPSCGWVLEGGEFCSDCGQKLDLD